eukprot:11158071-Lingulodinium_polyedra.AAC.1
MPEPFCSYGLPRATGRDVHLVAALCSGEFQRPGMPVAAGVCLRPGGQTSPVLRDAVGALRCQ